MNELVVALVLTVCVALGMWIKYAPFESIVSSKQKVILFTVYALASVFNMVLVLVAMKLGGITFAANYLRYGTIIYSVTLTIINILIIRNRVREHLFIFGVVLNCHHLLLYIPNYVITLIELHDPNVLYMVIILIYCAVLLLTYLPLRKLICDTVVPFLKLDSKYYWNTVFLIPLMFFIIKFISIGGERNTGSIPQLVSGFFSAVLMIFICISVANSYRRIEEKLYYEISLSDQKMHYAELQARVEDARKQKHDMKHYINAVRRYIELDDKDGLSHFCDDLFVRNNLDRTALPYTGNVAVDGIMYRYDQLSRDSKIDFKYSGTIKNHNISDIDLCVLLGNALDNAYTACLSIPDNRSITVLCESEKVLLTIIVRNSFNGVIKKEGDKFISLKRGDRPGVGMSSMQSICDHYGGTMEQVWEDDVFTLMIMLPNSGE